jgi:hypothetical protein
METLTDSELKALFHELWGDATVGEYNKDKWMELQEALTQRGILV